MKPYDFDTPVNRFGTDSYKWAVAEGELPMWVADMDFKAAPEILEALQARLDHGVFGYAEIPDAWYQAYIGWWETRHGFRMQKEGLFFCTGVVPAISSMVRKLTTPNENVLIQSPVYNIFYNSILNNGCRVLESPLVYENGVYSVDFADLEAKLADPQTTLMILCNPHNPIGKIWDRETLAKIGELAARYHVTVISDEIHCDLTEPDCDYIPFASVSEDCRRVSATCVAPTKAFNLAGLQTAAVYVPDPVLRHKVWRGLNTDEVAEPNAFATAAAVAAFTKGAGWLDALRVYLSGNRRRVAEFLAHEVPFVRLAAGKATYLLWINLGELMGGSREIAAFLRKETGLYLSAGASYGAAGDRFLRMNIACPRATLEDGLARLKAGLIAYREQSAR